jgi:RNA polymerase primary sigma factor
MKLEPDFENEYNTWKTTPSPQTMGGLLRKVQPVIDRGVAAYVGKQPGPVVHGSARKLAVQAIKNYDPLQAKLGTHITNNLQGLRRIARRQQNVLRVPERISLQQNQLHRAGLDLEDELGREPTLAELADHTGLSPGRIQQVRNYRPPVSEGSLLNMQSEGEDGYMPAVDRDPFDSVTRAVYDDLDESNQKILEWSLGLQGKAFSNQQIAAKLGVTPGAVSQRKMFIQQRLDHMASLGAF